MGLLIVCSLAFVLAVACVIIHYEAFRVAAGLAREAEVPRRGRLLLVILAAMIAHLLEIGCYAIVFWLCHGHPLLGVIEGKIEGNLFDFIYFSMTNYTTLGVGDVVAHGPLRLLATAEALTGLVLLSWTASFTYLSMENFWRLENTRRPPELARPAAGLQLSDEDGLDEGDGSAEPGRTLRQAAEIGREGGSQARRGDRHLAGPGARAHPASRQKSRQADGDRPHDESGELSGSVATRPFDRPPRVR